MFSKMIASLFALTFILTSSAEASSYNLTQYMNYYSGMILRNAGDNYSLFTLPLFTFDESDLSQPGWFGEFSTVCFSNSGKCVVAGKRGDYFKLYVADEESLANIRSSSLPNASTVAVVRVDNDTLYRLQARSN